jgi:hypothetical protein
MGFEEGQVPNFFVLDVDDSDLNVREELASLQVMASRALAELVVTTCAPTAGHAKVPSRWLP